MATQAQRDHMAALMDMLLAHRDQVHYPPHDVRQPLDARTYALTEQQVETILKHGGQIQADCSDMVSEICKWAGLADPNGLGYRRQGYTGTLLAHLPHYDNPAKARVGAICVFGPGTGHHATMVRKPGKNPLLFSEGQERDPRLIDFQSMSAYFSGSYTFLSIAHL